MSVSVDRVELDVAVPRAQQEEVLKNLSWIDPAIESIEFAHDNDRVLTCRYATGETPPATREQLKVVADRIARSITTLPVRIVYQTPIEQVRGCRAPYEALCQRRWVLPLGRGFHAYAGLFSELYYALDGEFRRQAFALDAGEYKFPALITMTELTRSGDLDSFPHNANFVAHLPEHAEAIHAFQHRVRARAAVPPQELAAADIALCPTVCYHYYVALQGATVAPHGCVATAVSPCYRFEGRAMTGLRRLREFNMREIMFLGTERQTRACRDTLLELQKRMLLLCGLQARIRNASDPFFLDSCAEKRVYQLGFDLKHEVVAALPEEGDWLAIGSVNYHQEFFGSRFGIRTDTGETVHSCCLGFGLDRWCMAIFAQHGLDPEEWPEGLRDILDMFRLERENTSPVALEACV